MVESRYKAKTTAQYFEKIFKVVSQPQKIYFIILLYRPLPLRKCTLVSEWLIVDSVNWSRWEYVVLQVTQKRTLIKTESNLDAFDWYDSV